MLIFGWGRQKAKDFGPVSKLHCENCSNEKFWTLHEISTWFTLFFIPVFPYKTRRLLLCPVCQRGMALEWDEFDRLRIIAESNADLVAGKINEEEYRNRMLQLKSGEKQAEANHG